MNQVVLIFPDQSSIADFLLSRTPGNAEVDSLEQSLTATLTPQDVEVAKKIYGAVLKAETPKN